jgi:hypothetical protein
MGRPCSERTAWARRALGAPFNLAPPPFINAVIPLLLAATPLMVEGASPLGQPMQVQTFDPVARAAVMAQQLPRQWSGSYAGFAGGGSFPVQLRLSSVTAMGQMVDVRGEMTVGGTKLPVQGNLNANSDQLILLLLGEVAPAGLENGGRFVGLQGFSLAGWVAPRQTNPGGTLVMNPVVVSGKLMPVRGLW